MTLALSPEQELIQRVVREFTQTELAPEATTMDREASFRPKHIEAMAPLGLLGMLLPEDAGGAGTDTLSFVLAAEEVARGNGVDATVLVMTNSLVSYMLHTGDEAHTDDLLIPVLQGKKLVGVGVAEEASGANYQRMVTKLTPSGDGFVLRGSKSFVGLASEAEEFLVLAKGPDGPTFVAVPAESDGFHVGTVESKLGLRGLPIADVYMNNVSVGKEQVVGTAGQGLEMIKEPLNLARLGIAGALVGLTQACLDSALEFAKERRQFGQPIARFGAVRGMLADVQAELEAARATTYGGAALRDARKAYLEEVFEARLLAHRIAIKGSRIAHKVHGGAGFMRDMPLERYSRDIRTMMHLWDAQDISRAHLADTLLS